MNQRVTAVALLLAAGVPALAQQTSPQPAQTQQDKEDTVGEISEDVAMVRFEKLGYQNVDLAAWTRNGDYLEATATRDGKSYKVSIHVFTGATAATPAASPSNQ